MSVKKKQQKKTGTGLRFINLFVSLSIMLLIWIVVASGFGPLPPPGPTLNPLIGIWNSAQNAHLPQTETLYLHGPERPVTVTFEKNGTPHIQAQTDPDLFWTMGYVQTYFRLFQMDLLRRQGKGLLSEIIGSSALDSDRLEDSLGLASIAQAQWDGLSSASPARRSLISYAQGVNARIQQDEQQHTLPPMFTLLNYEPQPWTPLDSLVIEGVMTQTLSFSTAPIYNALVSNSLGVGRAMQWFPILPNDHQFPYYPGPYATASGTSASTRQDFSSQAIQSIEALAEQLEHLPSNAIKHDSSSNSWAINGPKSATGQAMLAGDPHLDLSLPSIWFQVAGDAPGNSFSGVTIPGLPMILIGKTKQISWSVTDGQNQSTVFYIEKTDSAHPNQYYWNGSWRQMKQISYTIPVKGKAAVHFDVRQTVHGPIISYSAFAQQSIAVDWMGAQPSEEVDGLFKLVQSTNFTEFRNALRTWVAPVLNFVYADKQGNIALIAPGAYPIVKAGIPWVPLPGTGEFDVIGTIPFNDLPQVYDPPSHFIFTANQRPVGNDYPYYIGTSEDFDNGYRASEIYTQLNMGAHFTIQDMEKLQNSTKDYLAGLIVPRLLATLKDRPLSQQEHQAFDLLASWDDDMQAAAAAPAIWWTFWEQYLIETFQPWWLAKHVPADRFTALKISPTKVALDEDLENWTLHDPTNAVFSLPSGEQRTASDVMVKAFQDMLSILTKSLGEHIQLWRWGKLNVRTIPSLTGIHALGYGPVPSGGDNWTVNAIDYRRTIHGPSWRMIIDWGGGQSEGCYPGGQSEDPLSPWYQNEVSSWLQGKYYPMLTTNEIRPDWKQAIWTIQP